MESYVNWSLGRWEKNVFYMKIYMHIYIYVYICMYSCLSLYVPPIFDA